MAKTYKYLLDAHIFLRWLNDDKRLSDKMCRIIEDGNNIVLLSIVSVWEMGIKQSAGKLKIPVSIRILGGTMLMFSIRLASVQCGYFREFNVVEG